MGRVFSHQIKGEVARVLYGGVLPFFTDVVGTKAVHIPDVVLTKAQQIDILELDKADRLQCRTQS